MPGITGIIGKIFHEGNRDRLQVMVKCMMHEPFYTSCTYVNEGLGIWIGWVGHEGSFSDGMPVWNETRDVCLIFSGEDFTDQSEVDHLRIRGHQFNPENASYLVHLYEEMGVKFVEKLNGWFSGVLVDLQEQNIILFNNRYGIPRIFVHEGKNRFYFSSEAKALLAVLPDLREFDPKGLGEFLTCECTLESRSLYKGINILPQGALWTFVDGKIETKGSYFDLGRWIGQQRLDKKQFFPFVVESFAGLVKKYSGGSLPVGVSLTGGLDSRMIMACLNENHGKFPCYTFGSMYRNTFDVQTAREVAKACGQPYHTLVLGENFLRDFPKYLEKAVYISDGYLGLSGAAELYVNSLARQIAPVRLTGNYGGELLRGIRAFKYEAPKGAFVNSDLIPYLNEAQTTFQKLETNDALTFALFHQAPSQGYGCLAIERSQVILRTPFMDNGLVKLLYMAPSHLLKNAELSVAIISHYNPDLLKTPTDRGLLGDGSRFGGILRQLYRKAFIKAEYVASHGMPNWLAPIFCFGISGVLDKCFLGRDKFQHFRLWSQKIFAGSINNVLIEGGADLGEFFNKRSINSMVREHLAGRQNYIDEIDRLLTLSLAHNALVKGRAFETLVPIQ